jgi:hypothetical protein
MIFCSAILFATSKDQNERLCKARVLRDMPSIRQRCLPLFSVIRFIAWLVPWSWVGDSWGCSQVSRETSTYVESATLDAQTDEFLLVSSNDLEYLTREEAEQIIDRFNNVPQSSDRLLFWTGISALGDGRSSEPQNSSASPNDELSSQRTIVALYAPSCDGPGATWIFSKFMEFYQDLRCRYDQAHSTVLRLVP